MQDDMWAFYRSARHIKLFLPKVLVILINYIGITRITFCKHEKIDIKILVNNLKWILSDLILITQVCFHYVVKYHVE